MRIVIDLQGAQSESRFRGIGRYSLALALGLARNAGPHEVWLLLNGALEAPIGALRRAFDGLIAPERIVVFDCPAPVAEAAPGNAARTRAAELLRAYAIAQLRADWVLTTSLFEGYVDDAVTAVGALAPGAALEAVVLYDLIPLLDPAAYLPTPAQQQHYGRKVDALRRADLLLAISDYSRGEAIGALGLDPGAVVSISTAVEPCFAPGPVSPATLLALREQYGVTRKVLMYAPGGFDSRKNIDGLIAAYALLPGALRAEHQLLIASKLGEADRQRLLAHGRRCGLAADELVLTGYVSDATLIELYRHATLFVFASKYEGFGLPALEAMTCGAPVIGADNSSIPEAIGCAEALFDAASPQAMAAKIAAVLGDAALRERLRAHGREHAAKFSWDATARRAIAALEARHAERPAAAPPRARRRLAFVSPLPPERTGIADYALEILPALRAHFDIELVVEQAAVQLPPALADLPQRPAAWFAEHAGQYDQILYQFGNSTFHSHMFALLERHPGVVVLHDFFLSGVLAYEQISGNRPGAWNAALYHSHGYPGLRAGAAPDGVEAAKDAYPCSLAVLEGASRVIVHSEHALELARQWYGAQAPRDWSVAPHPRAAPASQDRAAARRALGIGEATFLVCSFGFIAPTKLTEELLLAWLASALGADPRCELVLVGANHGGSYGARIEQIIAAAPGARVRILGWCDDAVYHQYLQAADACVQLRSVSRGETSGAVLHCMNYGLATIVNANGAMAELPDDAVWRLPEHFTTEQLVAALEALCADPARRRELGERGRQLLRQRHSPENAAACYARALDLAWAEAPLGRPALLGALGAIAGLDTGEAALQQLAGCLAGAPDPLRQRQLLVDVTAIARHDLKTGIERVVRTQLLELLRRPLPGWRVEPVYLGRRNGGPQYRYARRYAHRLLGLDEGATHDAPLDVGPRDVFYNADFSPEAVLEAARAGIYANWRARGVQVNFMVYDLLPVLRPEFFPPGADRGHAAWLACVAVQADRLICISEAVRQDLLLWLGQQGEAGAPPVKLARLHLGADIDEGRGAAAPAAGSAAPDSAALHRCAAAPTFLMVGTLEPRKGHLQALAAFEQLWDSGVEANLVIVGREGWLPLAPSERRTLPLIMERLRRHAELGKRLFWLDGAADAELEQLYLASACLLAPSEGEGFGLPLIEAARFDLPILARDLPVFREVAQEHASYFSGLKAAELADAVRAWLAHHAQGAVPGSKQMPWLTWRENAAELLVVLEGRRAELRWPTP